MRCRWSAKQRLRLGQDRYRRCRGDAGANAKRFAHSCIKRYSLRRDGLANAYVFTGAINDRAAASVTNPNCDTDGYGDGDSSSYCNAYGNSHTFRYTYSYTFWKDNFDAETSSDSTAKTVETFATAKIFYVALAVALHERWSIADH